MIRDSSKNLGHPDSREFRHENRSTFWSRLGFGWWFLCGVLQQNKPVRGENLGCSRYYSKQVRGHESVFICDPAILRSGLVQNELKNSLHNKTKAPTAQRIVPFSAQRGTVSKILASDSLSPALGWDPPWTFQKKIEKFFFLYGPRFL